MSIAEIETLWTAAKTALDAADYSTALDKALALQLRLAATTDVSRSGNDAVQKFAFANGELIQNFIGNCRQRLAATAVSGGIQVTKLIPTRAGLT